MRALFASLVLVSASAAPFLKRHRSLIQSKQMPVDGDDFEYGDRESAVSQADESDFSIHQFLVSDDGREGSSTGGDDSGSMEMERSAAVAADDHFNSENTPDASDSFAQTAKTGKTRHSHRRNALFQKKQMPEDRDEFEYGDREAAVSQADESDFSVHQFLVGDDGREGSSAGGDDSGSMEMARSEAVAADDHFNSENTPDASDSFAQTAKKSKATHLHARHHTTPGDDDETGYEYGDSEANARNEDSSDFSVHQFLARDDGREGSDDSQDADGGAAAEMAKAKALASQDTFDSEDTPDTSLAQTGASLRHSKHLQK